MSNGPVKDIENVNLGQKAIISSLSAHHGTSHSDSSTGASLDLSLYPKLPEDGNDLENTIEAELVPAVIYANKKDPNLTRILSPVEDNSNDIEELKCPYCDNTFENVMLILHWHICASHKSKKKEYFRKLK